MEPDNEQLSMTFFELGNKGRLSRRTTNILRRNGLVSPLDLIAAIKKFGIYPLPSYGNGEQNWCFGWGKGQPSMRKVGPKTWREIFDFLDKCGFEWRSYITMTFRSVVTDDDLDSETFSTAVIPVCDGQKYIIIVNEGLTQRELGKMRDEIRKWSDSEEQFLLLPADMLFIRDSAGEEES
jgi:hypothetical protein